MFSDSKVEAIHLEVTANEENDSLRVDFSDRRPDSAFPLPPGSEPFSLSQVSMLERCTRAGLIQLSFKMAADGRVVGIRAQMATLHLEDLELLVRPLVWKRLRGLAGNLDLLREATI